MRKGLPGQSRAGLLHIWNTLGASLGGRSVAYPFCEPVPLLNYAAKMFDIS